MATRYSSISDVDKTYEVHGEAGRTEEAGHLISQEEMADWRNSKVISRAANGRQYLRFAFVGANLLLFAVSILALVSSRKQDPSLEMNYLLKQTSFYSKFQHPILEELTQDDQALSLIVSKSPPKSLESMGRCSAAQNHPFTDSSPLRK